MFVTPEQSRGLKRLWFAAAAWLLLGPWLAAVSSAPAPGQAYSVRPWETDKGLPHNSVISMIQTRDGYLWLGTVSGLARFDGLKFTVFNEGNTPGLSNSPIVCLFEDSRGGLWIGTKNAGTVVLKDGRITVPGQGELSGGGIERRLIAACEDGEGAVWLCLANGNLWRFHHGGLQRLLLPAETVGQPRSLFKEAGGPVWIVTSRRSYAVGSIAGNGSIKLSDMTDAAAGQLDFLVPSRGGGSWRLINYHVQKGATNTFADLGAYPWPWEVSSACEDHDGNLVVGTKGAGVYWVTPAGAVTSLSTNQSGSDSLTHSWVLSVLVDREGNLWAGTDGGGLNRIQRRAFTVPENLRHWIVQSVTEDAAGGLWVGSTRNGLAFLTNGLPQPFGSREPIQTVFADRDGQVWFSTNPRLEPAFGELFQIQNGNTVRVTGGGLIRETVQAIHQDRAGRMWFGMAGGMARLENGGWKLFTTREGLSSDHVTSLADDADGNLWIGTQRGGLNQFRDGKFSAFRAIDGLPSDNISALLVDEQGVLWVATSGGLGRRQHGKWTRYTARDGLTTDNLSYLLDDMEGNLWIGSRAGLLRIPKKALTDFANGAVTSIPCRAYGKDDGLVTGEGTFGSQPGAWRGRDGTLYFSTMKGVAALPPGRLRPNTKPPPVTIESVLIDDKPPSAKNFPAEPAKTLLLHPGEERLEIRYASLNLGAPEWARFRYRLQGYDKNWVEAGDVRSAPYPRLPAGHYTFHVTAANEDGVWNETGRSLAIIVQPPYWETWWFLSATTGCVIGLIVGIVRYLSTQKLLRQVAVLKQQEALEKERARIARDIHDQVGASLTQVALLGELVESDKDSPADVGAHARQISQTARETTRALDEIVWTVNPQNDTLEGLVNYICKNAQDYLAVAGVRYRFDVPTELPARSIAPDVRHNVFLASKEAVTNVVRHAKGSAAWIRVRVEPSSLTLEIEDNGRGLGGMDQEAAMRRNGLKNMRKRMEDIGGTFSLGPGGEGGALVRLTVPLKLKSE